MKTQLTKEQSQHLIDLGVSIYLASGLRVEYEKEFTNYINIFTLTDLLEILPKEIDIQKETYLNDTAHLVINGFDGEWDVEYEYMDIEKRTLSYVFFNAEELIDALYELCVWCLKKKYL